jgi:WbqC-like protein family
MKTVAIHQPNYLPWLGYFYKILSSDVFVILDSVDYQSGNSSSITNRTRIKAANGELLITVPVVKPKETKRIDTIAIDNKQNWQRKHLNSLKTAYGKSRYFDEVYTLIEAALTGGFDYIADLNTGLIELVCSYLHIETPMVRSSRMGLADEAEKNQRIIEICKRVEASSYLSGNGARKYNNDDLFKTNAIELKYSQFSAPSYLQLHGEFVPDLSVVDCLFNCGKDARLLLKSNGH